jgi:hypothetical protein
MIACTPRFEWPYILQRDRQLPPEQQTKFTLRALTGTEMIVVMNNVMGDRVARAIAYGLRGWNLKDAAGKEIPFVKTPEGFCDPANIDYIAQDPQVLQELATAITNREVLTDAETKN